jgi:hypothetical protein
METHETAHAAALGSSGTSPPDPFAELFTGLELVAQRCVRRQLDDLGPAAFLRWAAGLPRVIDWGGR